MEECYLLLGISPAASADEIEEAYQNIKRELVSDRFERNSEERMKAFSMMQKLDKAYNEAIMAVFAPIKAFAVSEGTTTIQSSYVIRPEVIGDLVEEAPVSFSDEQLLNMDIGE